MTDTEPPDVADEPGRWLLGADEVAGMLERGELERVRPSPDHADLLFGQAEGHLLAAAPLVDSHPSSAYNLLYDAARLAMTAALAKQGLRPTRAGGHLAVQEAVRPSSGQTFGTSSDHFVSFDDAATTTSTRASTPSRSLRTRRERACRTLVTLPT